MHSLNAGRVIIQNQYFSVISLHRCLKHPIYFCLFFVRKGLNVSKWSFFFHRVMFPPFNSALHF